MSAAPAVTAVGAEQPNGPGSREFGLHARVAFGSR
jgi:hypothetical protein